MPSPLVPNIGQALMQGGAFGQMLAGNIRQRRQDEVTAKATAEKSRIDGQQRAITNIASSANALLQFTDADSLSNGLLREAQNAPGIEGLDPADYLSLIHI